MFNIVYKNARLRISHYAFSTLASKAFAIVTVVLAARSLGLNDFSAFEEYINTAIMLIPLVTLCLPDALYHFCKTGSLSLTISLLVRILVVILLLSCAAGILVHIGEGVDFFLLTILTICASTLSLSKQVLRVRNAARQYVLAESIVYFFPLFYLFFSNLTGKEASVTYTIVSYIFGYMLSAALMLITIKGQRHKSQGHVHQTKIVGLLRFSIWLVPSSFLFGLYLNTFRYVDIEESLRQDLTIVFRIVSYQVICNAFIFLKSQDLIYNSLDRKKQDLKSALNNNLKKGLLCNVLIVFLSIPGWFAFTNEIPSLEVVSVVFVFNTSVMLYGWSAIFGSIMSYYGKQKTMMIQVIACMSLFFIVAYFIPSLYVFWLLLTSFLILSIRSFSAMRLYKEAKHNDLLHL